jgi:GT2 family glycosyltransferase/glycosyltransferase involved in cell wall biosynthesis
MDSETLDYAHAAAALRILVVNADVPPQNRDAGSLRLFRILELLVEDGHQVTLVGRAGIRQELPTAELAALGINVFPIDRARLRQLGARISGPDLDLTALLSAGRFDVALLSFYDVAEQYLPLIRSLSPLTRVVIDTVDVHHVRERRAAQLSGDPMALASAERTRVREQAIYGAADALVAVSEVDGAALKDLAPRVPVLVLSLIHPPVQSTPGFDGRDGLVFVGNFRHTPNVDAVLDFHHSCWPIIEAVRPGTRLTVVGTNPPAAISALHASQVAVTGWVPDVAPYLDSARVSIAPLRYGAGVKGKIGEALSRGLPVVTTSVGAEGMGLRTAEHVLVADGPTQFAAAVLRLHDDRELWEALRAAGPAYADSRFGIEAARAALRRLLEAAVHTPFVTQAGASGVARVIEAFTTTFSPGEPVSLILTVPDDEPGAAKSAFADTAQTLAQLGLDPEHVADIQICPARPDLILPARSVIVNGDTNSRSVSTRQPPARWRELSHIAVTRRSKSKTPRAAILLHAPDDATALAPQLSALQHADLGRGVEVVIAADPPGERMESLLRGLDGVRVVRGSVPMGRHEAWQIAASTTIAPVSVVLAPLAIPAPRFLDSLIGLVQAGAALAAPVVARTAGLRIAADGSLWPRRADEAGGPDALPLDCLAARSELFRDGLPPFPRGEGHVESQLAAWASQHGSLAVSLDAHVKRLTGPEASVIICTRNRADELHDCVALVLACGAGDVVIVDNGSTDATAAVAGEFARLSGGVVRLVRESRAGLCHARNAGALAARHEMLLYLDDDARVAPGWLDHLAWTLGRPGIVNAGGPISALWPDGRPPGWPGRELEPLLSVLDLGDVERTLIPPDVVYGANWAVRRGALKAVGGFDPDFGPGPESGINGDEVSVALRLHTQGIGATAYSPGAAVAHRIAPDRIDNGFLLMRSLCVGVEQTQHARSMGHTDRDQLMATATGAARQLPGVAALNGVLSVGDALDKISRAPLALAQQVQAANVLGVLAASAALLGEDEVLVGGLGLQIERESLLRGVVATAPASVRAA